MMADFYKAFQKLKGIEFSNESDALHKNKGEDGLTYYGIYHSAHPDWTGWPRVMAHLTTHGFDRRLASITCYHDENLTQEVMYFYYMNFWVKLRLDEITSQKIAEEMFFFYMNTGNKKKVVRYAQSIIGEVVDGYIGKNTIKALNEFDEVVFDKHYDQKQISHYKRIVAYNPKKFGRFLKGWVNRARLI